MLLNVRGKLLGVCLPQRLDCLIICFKFIKLLLVFLYASVKASFQLSHLTFEIGNLAFVSLFKLLLLSEQPLLVRLELLEALTLLFHVLPFEGADFSLPIIAFLGLHQLVLLPRDYSVGTG